MSPPLKIEEREGKGRTVIASQPLKSGQIIIKDSPILLYSAHNSSKYCSHCFSLLSFSLPSSCCPTCSAPFCSQICLSNSSATSHTPWACRALFRLRDGRLWARHGDEVRAQARFLVAAYNLGVVSPSGFRELLSLQGGEGEREGEERESAVFLHSVLDEVCSVKDVFGVGFSLETTMALLAKDKINAFGLMEPFVGNIPSPMTQGGSGGQQLVQQHRSVRAYGIYPNASLFNHDCLPNACRFDYIDQNSDVSSPTKNNTDIIIRMIHDVPEGREICLSYFPVNLSYRERQLRLRDDYGFVCSCDRCQVEANWSCSDDDDDDDDVAMDEDDDADESMEAGEEEDGNEKENDFPHAYFFLRYMCTQQDCWGTLAPLRTPPSSNGTTTPSSSFTVMECNVCGNLKNDEQEITDCQP